MQATITKCRLDCLSFLNEYLICCPASPGCGDEYRLFSSFRNRGASDFMSDDSTDDSAGLRLRSSGLGLWPCGRQLAGTAASLSTAQSATRACRTKPCAPVRKRSRFNSPSHREQHDNTGEKERKKEIEAATRARAAWGQLIKAQNPVRKPRNHELPTPPALASPPLSFATTSPYIIRFHQRSHRTGVAPRSKAK